MVVSCFFRSARKRRQRHVKKHAAKDPETSAAVVDAAAAGCGSIEDKSQKNEDRYTRSDAGSIRQDLLQHLDNQLISPGFATLSGTPSISSFESYEDELLPQTTKSIVMGDSEEKAQLQFDIKDSANYNLCVSEDSSGVLPQTTGPETSNKTSLGNKASSEVDSSSNQFCLHSKMEQRPDLEIFEVEEIEVTSSGSISPPECSSVNSPVRLHNQDELCNLSSRVDINSLNVSSHINALDRFAECAEASHPTHCIDSQFMKNLEELSRNPLQSATTSSMELDYWSRKGATDNPYSIQGV